MGTTENPGRREQGRRRNLAQVHAVTEREWPLHTLKLRERAVCMVMRNLNGELKVGYA